MPNRKRNILHILRGLAVPAVIGGLLWLGLGAPFARAGNPVTAPVIPAPKLKTMAPAALTSPVVPSPIKEKPLRETGIVFGAVLDETGKGLSAKIDLGDPGVPAVRTYPATGAFRVESAPGKYILEVKAEGYRPASKKLKVKANSETRVDFTLKAEPMAPAPITSPVIPAPVTKIKNPGPATSPVVPPAPLPAKPAPAAATSAVIPSPKNESPEPVTGTVSGVVLNDNGKFLSAKVDFGDPGIPTVRTDPATGAFRVKTAPGRYRLEVKAEGYQPESKKLKVKAGGETRADFTLKAEKKKLAPAAVTSPVVPPAELKTQPPSAVTSPVIPPRAAAAVPPILEIFPPGGEIQNGYQDEDGCPDTLFLGIKGRLLDRQTGQPVEALLTITKERASEILKTLKGIWVWKSAVPGRYTLKIEAEGYQPQVLNFFLLSGQEIILDLRLAPLAAAR